MTGIPSKELTPLIGTIENELAKKSPYQQYSESEIDNLRVN
jgi:hypothetical protein